MPTGAEPTLAEAESGQPAVMGFFDHLAELRRRLLFCLAAVAVCCLLGVMFWQEIYTFLSAPMSAAFAQAGLGDKRLIFTGPLVPIKFALQVGLYAGLFLSSPSIFWQGWLFVATGLYRPERRLVPRLLLS